MSYLKRYPISLLIVCAIVYLSLIPIPETEMNDIPLIDKWAHICMYGGLSVVVWIEYLRSHSSVNFLKALLLTAIAPLALSGTMELMQAYCTTTRSGDWLDMIANSIGIVLGTLAGYGILRRFIKKSK